jgi:hypothetical protein
MLGIDDPEKSVIVFIARNFLESTVLHFLRGYMNSNGIPSLIGVIKLFDRSFNRCY